MAATETRERGGLPTGFLSDGPPCGGALRWYAVHVPEGREEAAAGKCRRLLAPDLLEDCFVPKRERYMKLEGSWRLVVRAMFGEYALAATRDVRALSEALGRLSLPASLAGRRGRDCAALSPGVQKWLEAALDGAHVLRASEGRIEGGVLRVERGPLRGCEGRVRRIDRHKRTAYLRFDEGGERDCVLQAALSVPAKS